jgi:hypothetical protein
MTRLQLASLMTVGNMLAGTAVAIAGARLLERANPIVAAVFLLFLVVAGAGVAVIDNLALLVA